MRNLQAIDLFTDSELRLFQLPLTSPLRSGGNGLGKPADSDSPIRGTNLRVVSPTQGNELCEECEHPIRSHGKYGCEYERGDNLAGTAALPPCGCKAHPDYHSRPLDDYDNDMSAAEEESDGPDPHDMEVETEMERERRA